MKPNAYRYYRYYTDFLLTENLERSTARLFNFYVGIVRFRCFYFSRNCAFGTLRTAHYFHFVMVVFFGKQHLVNK